MSRTAFGPTQPPLRWVPRALSLGVERPGLQADRSPPSNAEVKNVWSYTSTLNVFMVWFLVKHRDSFIFLPFTTASRTALGPTQPPMQWVPGALSLAVKRPGCKADHSPPSSAEVKEWVKLYLHSPNTPPWRGAQLKHRDLYFTKYKETTLLIINSGR
jgi:hypothetical protein